MRIPQARNTWTVARAERSAFFFPAVTVWASMVIWLLVQRREAGLFASLQLMEKQSWLVVVAMLLIALGTVFAIGHVVELLSQSIVERFLADKLDGFPHERLLPAKYSTVRYVRFSRMKRSNLNRPTFFYEGAKLFISSSSLFFLFTIVSNHPIVINSVNGLFIVLALATYALIGIAAAFMIAVPAVVVRYFPWRDYAARRHTLARILKALRARRQSRATHALILPLRLLSYVFAWPLVAAYDLIDRLVRGIFRLNKEIDESTFLRVTEILKVKTGLEYLSLGTNDRFWLLFLIVSSNRPELLRTIQSIRTAADFCRNQALACLVASLFLATSYADGQGQVTGMPTRSDLVYVASAVFVLGWIFHWKFLHLYYSCTKMTFRAFATLDSAPAKKKRPKPEKPVSE